jgi:hypothetical protein
MKNYKYDVAISLCKQDVEYAHKLVTQLNPSLSIFFYENNQEGIINKSGAEEFAKIFKNESRIVVVLSRKEWSNSYYTEIERNAIIDKTSVKNEGYDFLFVIPMEEGEIPEWYPSTRIYANPKRFSVEQLARFIEFKVAEKGGKLKEITVEDRYQNLLNKIENKKKIIKLQESEEAISYAKEEVENFKNLFDFKTKIFDKGSVFSRSCLNFGGGHHAYFGIGNFQLRAELFIKDYRIVTTQDFELNISLIEQTNEGEIELASGDYLYYYNPWAHKEQENQQMIYQLKNTRKTLKL